MSIEKYSPFPAGLIPFRRQTGQGKRIKIPVSLERFRQGVKRQPPAPAARDSHPR